MQIVRLFILKSLTFLVLFWGCTHDEDNIDNEYGLKLTISAEYNLAEPGNPFTVHTTINNFSHQDFNQRIIAGFELLNDQGYAVYASILSQVGVGQNLVVKPYNPFIQDVEITSIFWSRPMDSKLADETLFDLVAEGNYLLRMFLEIVPEKQASSFSYSNEISVMVKS